MILCSKCSPSIKSNPNVIQLKDLYNLDYCLSHYAEKVNSYPLPNYKYRYLSLPIYLKRKIIASLFSGTQIVSIYPYL